MTYCFNLTEIIVAAIGAIEASAFLTIKITNRKTVIQKENTIQGGGDIVGGNKTTHN